MKFGIVFFYCLLTCGLSAQTITTVEYFIDTDPGFGNGTHVAVTPGMDIALDFTVDVASLGYGFHVLYLRGRDSDGRWSIAHTKSFYKQFVPDIRQEIEQVEYFLDSDPGFGNGQNVTLAPGQDISLDFIADLGGLDDGFHVLYTRGLDSNGKWSLMTAKSFHVQSRDPAGDITQVKYYISNTDTVTPISSYSEFTAAPDVALNFKVDISDLTAGMVHDFHIFGVDEYGRGGIEYIHSFTTSGRVNSPPYAIHPLQNITMDPDFGIYIVADLDSIFTDPDLPFGDSLRYSVTVSNGTVTADVWTTFLRLTSVDDSVGSAEVIVCATDDSGGVGFDTMIVSIITDIQSVPQSGIPIHPFLMQNYPNPFNPVTQIRFGLPKSSHARLAVYNVFGERLTTLVNEMLHAGHYSVTLNAGNYASGVYYYRIIAGGYSEVKRMVLLK